MGLPAIIILSLARIGIAPTNPAIKNTLEASCIAIGLGFGLPGSVSIFPPVSMKKGTQLEEEFHQHEKIYFSKGL